MQLHKNTSSYVEKKIKGKNAGALRIKNHY